MACLIPIYSLTQALNVNTFQEARTCLMASQTSTCCVFIMPHLALLSFDLTYCLSLQFSSLGGTPFTCHCFLSPSICPAHSLPSALSLCYTIFSAHSFLAGSLRLEHQHSQVLVQMAKVFLSSHRAKGEQRGCWESISLCLSLFLSLALCLYDTWD